MTDQEDFLIRIRRLQAASQGLSNKLDKDKKANKANKARNPSPNNKPAPNMVVSVRVDPARITLSRLRFMGEEPNYAPEKGIEPEDDEKEQVTCPRMQN